MHGRESHGAGRLCWGECVGRVSGKAADNKCQIYLPDFTPQWALRRTLSVEDQRPQVKNRFSSLFVISLLLLIVCCVRDESTFLKTSHLSVGSSEQCLPKNRSLVKGKPAYWHLPEQTTPRFSKNSLSARLIRERL